MIAIVISLSLLLFSATASAHPGALNSAGCHFDHRRGDYHCHGISRGFRYSLPATLFGLALTILPSLLSQRSESQSLETNETLELPARQEARPTSINPSVPPAPAIVPPAAPEEPRPRSFPAQLYLIKGPIVSLPPQTFNAEFLSTGKAQVVLSGRRLLRGDFELFDRTELIKAKYEPRLLVNPDNVKPLLGADAKGFAVFSDGTGLELECTYSISRATGLGAGVCADNQRNTYRIVFD